MQTDNEKKKRKKKIKRTSNKKYDGGQDETSVRETERKNSINRMRENEGDRERPSLPASGEEWREERGERESASDGECEK